MSRETPAEKTAANDSRERGAATVPVTTADVARRALAAAVRLASRLSPRSRLALSAAALLLLAWTGTGYDYEPVEPREAALTSPAGAADRAGARELARLGAERARLASLLRQRVPRGSWIVIDQTHNRLRLMRGETLVLEASCSAGSGMVLKEGPGKRVWVFDTPRGYFRVIAKLQNPVWRRPDWAFVEEGEPIPKDPALRFEYGSLGEYALYFGDGYMIHGTLYERLLGRPVSHGCIRLGRDPLREVYRDAPVGTPIYVF
jgi:L,D-transpeptidase catalytic domain